MRYTLQQVRELTGISQETLRYWRKTLPPLMEKRGKAPSFTAGDLLSLIIIREIVEYMEMNIAVLKEVADQLFEACKGIRWQQLANQYLIIDFCNKQIKAIDRLDSIPALEGPCIFINIEHKLQNVRESLLNDEITQFELAFGPTIVKSRHNRV